MQEQIVQAIERQKTIKELIESGKTFAQVGSIMKLSRQRVHSIYYHNYEQSQRRDSLADKFPQLRKLNGREYTRELVRIRDNFTCQDCKKIWEPGQRRFDVHHLSNDPTQSRAYDRVSTLDGMVTLCHKCHLSREKPKKFQKFVL